MTDHTLPAATEQLRCDIVATLDVAAFDPGAYHDRGYVEAAREAEFDVSNLAQAQMSRKRPSTAPSTSTMPTTNNRKGPGQPGDSGTPTRRQFRVMTDRRH